MASPTSLLQSASISRGEEHGSPAALNDRRPDQPELHATPIRRLPYELLSEVLLQLAMKDAQSLLNALGVCRYWRDVALHTPRAWSYIVLNDLGSPDLLNLCIERSGELKLSLQTYSTPWHGKLSRESWKNISAKTEVLRPHLERIYQLEIWGPGSLRRFEPLLLEQSWPNLDTLILKSCPASSTLINRNILPSLTYLDLQNWPHFPSFPSAPQCPVKVLSFRNVGLWLEPVRSFSGTLEELRLLTFKAQRQERVYDTVHLPRLVKLTLSGCDWPPWWPEYMKHQQSSGPVAFSAPRLETFINESGASGILDDESLSRVTSLTTRGAPDFTRYPSVWRICMLEVQFGDLLLFLENLALDQSWFPRLGLVDVKDPVMEDHTSLTMDDVYAMDNGRLLRHEYTAGYGWRFWLQPLAT